MKDKVNQDWILQTVIMFNLCLSGLAGYLISFGIYTPKGIGGLFLLIIQFTTIMIVLSPLPEGHVR